MATMDDWQAKLLEQVAELDVKGRTRAFDLLTVSHLKCVPKTDGAVTGLVTKLFAVIGLLPALRKLLLVTKPSPVITPAQLEIISNSVQSCRSILCKIDAVVCETDKQLLPIGATSSAHDPQLAFLSQQEQQNAQDLLTTCFLDLVVIVSAARASHLERFGYLTGEQTLEGMRLREALAHPDYKQSPKRVHPDIASFGNWPPSPNQSNSTLDPPLQSMPEHQNVVAEGLAPSSSPPLSTAMTPATTRRSTPVAGSDENQLELIISFDEKLNFDKGKGDNTTKPFHLTPTLVSEQPSSATVAAATSSLAVEANRTTFLESVDSKQLNKNTSQLTGDQYLDEALTTPQKDAATKDSNKNSPTNPISPIPREIHATSPLAGMQKSGNGNLEAYILRPQCDNTYDTIEWSYQIKLLPLKNTEIEDHMKTLGPDYSVINSVGDLLPEELRLILIKVKIRNGHLLSIQRAREVDLATKMGTFKVQSIIFVLKSAKDPEIDSLRDNVPTSTLPKTNLFGNPNPPKPFGGFGTGALFGTNTGFGNGTGFGATNTNDHAGGFGTGTGFGRPIDPFGRGFGNGTIQPALRPGIFGSEAQKIPPHIGTARPPYNPHIWEVDAAQYLTQIKNEGDVCQYIEYDNSRAPNGIQHFQAITFNPDYRHYSFEELRLRDQKEGRTGPKPANSPFQPIPSTSSDRQGIFATDAPSSQPNINAADLGGGGLFGSLPSSSTGHQRLGDQHLQTKSQNTGWFGTSGAQPTLAPGAGLFGSTQPTTSSSESGLFNTFPTTSSNQGLFGGSMLSSNNSPPPPLFGNSQSSTSVGLFRRAPPGTTTSVLPPFGSAVTSQPIQSQQQRPSPFASNSAASPFQDVFGTNRTNNTSTLAQPGTGLFGSSYIPPRKE